MKGFATPSQICEWVGGQWLRFAPDDAPLAGVGIDSRGDLRGKAFIAIRGPRHDGHDYPAGAVDAGATLLIVERLVDLKSIPPCVGVMQVSQTRRALQEVASAWRRQLVRTKVIAVTGSVGKTTTRTLIHAALSAKLRGSQAAKSFNNDIGVPLTILAARRDDDFIVVEVGTNAPGEIDQLGAIVRPDVAVITAIGRSHLERLGDLAGVAREKASLLRHLQADGVAIVTADSQELRRRCAKGNSRLITYGLAEDAMMRLTGRGATWCDGRWWLEINQSERFEVALHGAHNALNAIAAVAVARHTGLSDEQIQHGLDKAESAQMRFNTHAVGPVHICNDAYNASPESMRAAFDTFAELAADAPRRVVILGDMLELGEHGPALHREVGRALASMHSRREIARVVLVGPLCASMLTEIAAFLPDDCVLHIDALEERSAERIAALVEPGDWVLLKGSRGMALERIIPHIEARFSAVAVADR